MALAGRRRDGSGSGKFARSRPALSPTTTSRPPPRNTLARLVAVLLLSSWPGAVGPEEEPPAVPVTIPGASRFDVASKAGQPYRIFVYVPDAPAPAAGYPVMYALDGNSSSGIRAGAEGR